MSQQNHQPQNYPNYPQQQSYQQSPNASQYYGMNMEDQKGDDNYYNDSQPNCPNHSSNIVAQNIISQPQSQLQSQEKPDKAEQIPIKTTKCKWYCKIEEETTRKLVWQPYIQDAQTKLTRSWLAFAESGGNNGFLRKSVSIGEGIKDENGNPVQKTVEFLKSEIIHMDKTGKFYDFIKAKQLGPNNTSRDVIFAESNRDGEINQYKVTDYTGLWYYQDMQTGKFLPYSENIQNEITQGWNAFKRNPRDKNLKLLHFTESERNIEISKTIIFTAHQIGARQPIFIEQNNVTKKKIYVLFRIST